MIAYLIVTAAMGVGAAALCSVGLARKDTFQVLQALVVMMMAGILATIYGALNSM